MTSCRQPWDPVSMGSSVNPCGALSGVSGSGSWQLVCVFQFCANDPEVFVQAALLAQDYCDAVDLNLGCPQMIAKRGEFLSGFLCRAPTGCPDGGQGVADPASMAVAAQVVSQPFVCCSLWRWLFSSAGGTGFAGSQAVTSLSARGSLGSIWVNGLCRKEVILPGVGLTLSSLSPRGCWLVRNHGGWVFCWATCPHCSPP